MGGLEGNSGAGPPSVPFPPGSGHTGLRLPVCWGSALLAPGQGTQGQSFLFGVPFHSVCDGQTLEKASVPRPVPRPLTLPSPAWLPVFTL